MKIISDIRLYKSEGSSDFSGLADRLEDLPGEESIRLMARRIAMKLRERQFSMGNFDHLYLAFTAQELTGNGDIEWFDEADPYHPWYRLCRIRVSSVLYQAIAAPENRPLVIDAIARVLTSRFATEAFDAQTICSCIEEAVEQGAQMQMKIKEKVTARRRAIVFFAAF